MTEETKLKRVPDEQAKASSSDSPSHDSPSQQQGANGDHHAVSAQAQRDE